MVRGFTKTYDVRRLVYFEMFESIESAIRREKRQKKYKREWKMNLIQQRNVGWKDLFETLGPS